MDPQAQQLAELFDAHFEAVVRSLLRLGAAGRDVEDLAQEVFLVAHRRLTTLDRSRPARPWLLGIAVNVLRDWSRRASHARERLTEDGNADEPHTDPAIRRVEAVQLVHRALRAVPVDRREVFVLHDLDQLSAPEVAEQLGLPLETVWGRLRTARDEFRAAVRRARQGAA